MPRLFFFSPWWYWGLASGPYTCSACTLPLEPCLPDLFALVIFQKGSHVFFPKPASDPSPPTYTSHIAGITGVDQLKIFKTCQFPSLRKVSGKVLVGKEFFKLMANMMF
jgi:hypothetical protein